MCTTEIGRLALKYKDLQSKVLPFFLCAVIAVSSVSPVLSAAVRSAAECIEFCSVSAALHPSAACRDPAWLVGQLMDADQSAKLVKICALQGVKLATLSCDAVESHTKWLEDVVSHWSVVLL